MGERQAVCLQPRIQCLHPRGLSGVCGAGAAVFLTLKTSLFYEMKTNGELSFTLELKRIYLWRISAIFEDLQNHTENPMFSGILLSLFQEGKEQGFALYLAKYLTWTLSAQGVTDFKQLYHFSLIIPHCNLLRSNPLGIGLRSWEFVKIVLC